MSERNEIRVEARAAFVPARLSWRTRLRWWWARKRLGAEGRKIMDELGREHDRALLYGERRDSCDD